jgi:hypothetical protein
MGKPNGKIKLLLAGFWDKIDGTVKMAFSVFYSSLNIVSGREDLND